MYTENLVYLGLGGNIGDRLHTLQKTLDLIAAMPDVTQFTASSLYETAPISEIPQPDYLNAVCCFYTLLTPYQLLSRLQAIEKLQGKGHKPKNAPRVIDIDILFFGMTSCHTEELVIPHPRWTGRLFVIVPLLELTKTIAIKGEHGEEIVDLLALKDSLEQEQDQRVVMLRGSGLCKTEPKAETTLKDL